MLVLPRSSIPFHIVTIRHDERSLWSPRRPGGKEGKKRASFTVFYSSTSLRGANQKITYLFTSRKPHSCILQTGVESGAEKSGCAFVCWFFFFFGARMLTKRISLGCVVLCDFFPFKVFLRLVFSYHLCVFLLSLLFLGLFLLRGRGSDLSAHESDFV
jgi:hypothetical protein